LAVHNERLFAAADADPGHCVFGWDGREWLPIGSDLYGSAGPLAVWNNTLVVAGFFRDTDDAYVADFASWDGASWTSWGFNMDDEVITLAVSPDGSLIAGGWFTQAGSTEVASVARWDGDTWSALGTGLDGPVYALARYGNDVTAGGEFEPPVGVEASNLASWDGTSWNAIHGLSRGVGMDAWVYALTFYDGDLIAGGKFDRAGLVDVQHIARWDGTSWHALSGGFQGESRYTSVRALIVYDGRLLAGGIFDEAGGLPARNIAAWDGSSWQPLGAGFNGDVFALELFEGDLIAAGRFTDTGGTLAPRIARWDGGSWSRLGHGFNDDVYALTVHEGSLVAGGLFTASDAGLNNRLARWTGTRWVDIGAGQGSKTIYALGVYEGSLIAGAGGRSYPIQGTREALLRWDGQSWNNLGSEIRGIVRSITVFDGELVIGGAIAKGIARWNGSSWSELGNGIVYGDPHFWDDQGTLALAGEGPDLFAGGNFKTAGPHESRHIALWRLDSTPVAIENLEASASPGRIRLQWQLSASSLRDLSSVFVQRADGPNASYASRTPIGLEPRRSMSFVDPGVEPDRAYWYRIVLLYGNGTQSNSATVVVRTALLAQAILCPPVESNGQVHIRFGVAHPRTPVHMEIFDVRGRLIQSLNLGIRDPGEHVHIWNRSDASGVRAPRGVYFARLRAAPIRMARKFVLVQP
jgi:hypothetical protein